ncbi:MAG: hypothetical protein JWR38_3711 [Mucilaginibacter sp.]|nr:hypothetical protein [Mucilaginibacter sp.]
MNIKNYYKQAVLLVLSLGFITIIQSCTKNDGVVAGSSPDTNLIGAWKTVISRFPKGDSVQTVAFYEGTPLASLTVDVYATPGSSATSTLYKGAYDTNGTQLYVKLNQKQDSATDLNGSGTPVNQVLFDTVPYKITADTLSITSGSTTLKYIKVK